MNFFKRISVLLLIIFLFPIFTTADDLDDEETNYISTLATSSNFESINLASKYCLVLERSTNTVLFEQSGYTKTAMASTTKIMTAIIALENSSLSDIVQISSKAAHTGGSTLGIYTDTTMTMENLLYGLLLRSGNDCAVAIAEHIGGSLEGFASLMNKKAKSLNLRNTNFVTPHGLDNEQHYTTAYDLAILTNYALKNETFNKIVGTKSCSITVGDSSKTITNTHELLGITEGLYGVKTGFTGNAGRCLVSACKRDNLDIIIVVLGANTKKQRTLDSVNLINYIYKNYEMYDFKNLIDCTFSNFLNNYSSQILVTKSTNSPQFVSSKLSTYIFPIKKMYIEKINCSIYTLRQIKPPISRGTKIGLIQISVNNIPIINLDILLKNNLEKKNFKQYFIQILKTISSYSRNQI